MLTACNQFLFDIFISPTEKHAYTVAIHGDQQMYAPLCVIYQFVFTAEKSVLSVFSTVKMKQCSLLNAILLWTVNTIFFLIGVFLNAVVVISFMEVDATSKEALLLHDFWSYLALTWSSSRLLIL